MAEVILTGVSKSFGDEVAVDNISMTIPDGAFVVLLGPTGAGKTTTLRLISGLEELDSGDISIGGRSVVNDTPAQRDVAIVSEIAGTTRDIIEVHLDLGGYPVIAADTAGLRDSAEPIEQEGVRRARVRAEAASLRLAVFDFAHWPPESETFDEFLGAGTIIAINKVDLAPSPETLIESDFQVFPISVKTGAGIEALLEALGKEVAAGFDENAAPVVTRARHREALEACVNELKAFLGRDDRLKNPEIGAEDLRLAARALGRVTGRVDVEDLLDVIFSDFCIGK